MLIRFSQRYIFIFLFSLVYFNCSLAEDEVNNSDWERINYILETIQSPQFSERDFLISDYGAIGDGKTDVSAAIAEAIYNANKEGGGRVVVPVGVWFSKGPIHLKSNVNLHISDGATLLFSDNPKDYLPQVLTRWEGTEAYNFSPLIYAYQATNVAITGGGIIDGNSESGFGTWRDKQSNAQNRLREMGNKGIPVFERVFGMDDFLRPNMIQFFGCNKIMIEGVTIVDSPMWVIHLVYSENVIVRDITIESFRLNNDGVDIDSSNMILVENNRFFTGDDSIVIKAGRDQDGWRIGRASEDIVIRNNYMEGHNALAIGSEMSGGVRRVYMEDNQLGKVRSAIYFKSNLDRGGFIENIRVRNIDVQEANILVRFNTDYQGYRGNYFPPIYRNFLIENISAKKVETAIEARGVSGSKIQDVQIRNMRVSEANIPIDTIFVENFSLQNVVIN